MLNPEKRVGNVLLILFDWSGVISDDRPPVYEANMRLLERYGHPRYPFSEWLPRTQLSVREMLLDHGVHADLDKAFREYSKLYTQIRQEGIHPKMYPDARISLSDLLIRGKRLRVLSSHPEINLHSEANEYGLSECFEKFYGSVKDKAITITTIREELDIMSDSVLYVGDTIYDIQSAKRAGVRSAGVTTGYHVMERLRKECPDLLATSLTELVTQIQ